MSNKSDHIVPYKVCFQVPLDTIYNALDGQHVIITLKA